MKATLFSACVLRFGLFAAILILSAQVTEIFAQAPVGLSVQGILKKSNGDAVDDGEHSMIFKLYTAGGAQVGTSETQLVPVSNGIYSTILGVNTPSSLTGVTFDQQYFLGITIGGTEMAPRIPLTSAPYAMSLIGNTNKFPSSGLVLADNIQVNGSVLAQSGAPGADGVDNNGYAFSNNNGNNGDKDSGLFSKGLGTVSLYVNNAEVLEATPGKVAVTGNLDVSGDLELTNLNLPSGGNIRYNNLNGWRLVEEDYFGANAEDWKVYAPTAPQAIGWNNPNSVVAAPVSHFTGFAGDALVPADNREVLKKLIDLSTAGTFTHVKVRFRYYFIDTWGFGPHDLGWAAFSTDAAGNDMRVGWSKRGEQLDATDDFNNAVFESENHFAGIATVPDHWNDVEMTAKVSGSFWLFIGAALDELAADENYGVGAVEIWVK